MVYDIIARMTIRTKILHFNVCVKEKYIQKAPEIMLVEKAPNSYICSNRSAHGTGSISPILQQNAYALGASHFKIEQRDFDWVL